MALKNLALTVLVAVVAAMLAATPARAGGPVTVELLPWDAAYVRGHGQRGPCLYATARPEHRDRLFPWVGPMATRSWAVYGEQPLFLACNPQTGRKIVTKLADALEGMKADGAFNQITAENEKRYPR